MSNDKYILNGQTFIDGWENSLKDIKLSDIDIYVPAVSDDDNMPRTKEAAIDYLNKIGWLQKHDKALSVKDGKWIPSKEYLGYSSCSICSNCYIETSYITKEKWNYCPNCGSHMIYEELNSVKNKKPDFTGHEGQLVPPDSYPN